MSAGDETEEPPGAPRLFAHRGGMADCPENTIEAFVRARRLGVRGVETDVWLTADAVPVLHHARDVRTAGGRRPIATLDRADLPAYIPSLADLYAAIGTELDVAIDILDRRAAASVVATAAAAGGDAAGRLWLCSQDLDQLTSWKGLCAPAHLVHSDARWRKRRRHGVEPLVAQLCVRGIDVLNLRHRYCSRELAAVCHAHHVSLFAWGVQRTARMRRLIREGVDGIMSDHVDRLLLVAGDSRIT